MSKTITIPKDRDPFVVIVNGVEYKYPAGETVTVPDSVADVIEKYENAKPKPDPNPAPGGSVQPDWNQNDSSAADFIKNKPFYEETTVVSEPLNITWDGNTAGLVGVDGVYGVPVVVYKVSDLVLTDEQIKSATVTVSSGDTVNLADVWEFAVVTEDYVIIMGGAIFVRKSGLQIEDLTFPEAGIYFFIDNEFYTSNFTTIEPIEQVKTVVHPINKKYLPDGIGGNMFINITMDDNDEYVADKTYDEISKAIESGIIPYCVFYGTLFNLSSSESLNAIQTYFAVKEHRFSNLFVKGTGNTMVSGIAIGSDNNVSFTEYSLTVTAVT